MATFRKRGNLQWEARVRRKGYPTTCKTFEIKADAEAWARSIEAEMDKGAFVTRKEAESTTLGELLQRYLEEKVPSMADPVRDGDRVKFIQKRPIALRILSTIRGKDIAAFIKDRASEGVGENTIRLDCGLLSRVFNYARRNLGMESLSNPVELVEKPKAPPGRVRRISKQEMEQLLACASPLSFQAIVRFAVESAMRRSEIASLVWEHVDLAQRTAYLPKTKNGEERTVPLSPTALEILEQAKLGRTGNSVFSMGADAITQAMERARKKAGIENLHFHDLRHEAISRLFEETDLDVMEIKSISGHRSLQMLARYSHLRAHHLAHRLAGAKRGERVSPTKESTAPVKTLGRPRKGE